MRPLQRVCFGRTLVASTGLEDLLGVPDREVTKDRLYRHSGSLAGHARAIENDLKDQLGTSVPLEYDLLLYDLTSTYFEGLAEENDLAKRGYSRDHRRDCKQVVLALIVTRDGFPLAHHTLAGNTQDVQTVKKIVTEVEKRFGKTQRIWVMDRGMISEETLAFLRKSERKYLLATRRSELARLQTTERQLARPGEPRRIMVKPISVAKHYLLARSRPRRQKERAIRRRQRRALARACDNCSRRSAAGRLKSRDKILERMGRLKGKYPKARPSSPSRSARQGAKLSWTWNEKQVRPWLATEFICCGVTNPAGLLRNSGKSTCN